jgi:hypothetical protein
LKILEPIRIQFDLAAGVIILQGDDPEVLLGMCSLVAVQLCLAEQQDLATPAQGVLVEPVVPTSWLPRTLIIGQRISGSSLPQDVDLIFGVPLKPTFKIL